MILRFSPAPGIVAALASAVLFGASTPFAKLLLANGVNAWLLASLLYLGSGVGLFAFRLTRKLLRREAAEAPLTRAELPWLFLVVLSGGVAGPVLLMLGLAGTPASTASLLLNVEGLATLAIAWIAFRENVDRRLLLGAAAILSGAVLLSWSGGPTGGGLGALAVIGACLAWGIDNNFTRKLSAADPVQIAMLKGLAAGTTNLILALALGASFPAPAMLGAAALVGLLGYGISLALFVLAMRHLGTARSGAYFSTAPFIGALLSIPMFGEPLSVPLILAGLLMAVGLWLHLSEAHEHEHTHLALEHAHRHIHDAHHQHEHEPGVDPRAPHSHRHRHAPMVHRHAHYPDLHHRHSHPH
ncbi:EamA family transporter [Sphingomonas sp. R-74633]|uniref:DMT family transporter n=1 Tax=Sphingomonas sp. R-74633 TaxID=2751188 RepID=UPI0015D1BDB9|nr:DMT family transporter [Sphingomonas sp. R-74633]NYT40959.1 EamA family transporter [Sphingomonas sp. R-74633]